MNQYTLQTRFHSTRDALSIPVYCGEDQVPNIYEATQDIYVADTCVDEELVRKSPYQMLEQSRPVVLDPLAPDYKDVFVKKGTVLAPDELLHMMRPLALKIPLKLREDFDSDPLPDSSLLQAIQYYASAANITPSSMDETALLALGLLVELWVDEELKACDENLFMEPPGPVDMLKYAPPELEESENEAFSEEDVQSGENGADGADSESDHQFAEESDDVMSLELLESDTASEVEGGRGIKRRKITLGKDKSGSNSAEDSSSSESKNSDSEDSDSDSDGSDSDSDDSDSNSDGSESNSDGEDSRGSRKPGRGKGLGKSAEKEKPVSHMDIGALSSESQSESGGEEGAGAGRDNSDPELLQGYADASDNLSSD